VEWKVVAKLADGHYFGEQARTTRAPVQVALDFSCDAFMFYTHSCGICAP